MRHKVPAGEIVHLKHESDVLKGNAPGDPHVRDLIVYLPPGYAESDASYPSVYCLTGFTGRGKMLLNDSAFTPNLAERMDRLIASGKVAPMVLVMPDCFTFYGGSQYINSTATGRYEDYLVDEIVPFVDSNFRTLARPSSRAVMGKSSGGYGSLVLTFRHPDTFGLCCSTSGDAYFEVCYPADFPAAFRSIKAAPKQFMEDLWKRERLDPKEHAAVNTIGMSACYAPNGGDFDLPFDLATGEWRQDVWQRWLEHDPVRLVERYADGLKTLRLLFLDAGTKDEFNLDIAARVLSKTLTEFGIDHLHEEFDDGHFNISYRNDRSLELISERIER